ncbi:MAG TPA: DUF445 family protein [Candidatus Acidoferrales bacterium]|nr:DUF445 family protein [Candidatus Acidoferrales bacterium]
MYSSGVAFLIGIGAALTNLLKKTRLKREALFEDEGAAGSAAGSSWPQDLPRVQPRQFVLKWVRTLTRKLALARRKSAAPAEVLSAPARAKKPLSLKVAAALNLLYWPFFYSGIVISAWFAADSVLQLAVSSATYGAIAAVADPVLTVLTPTAVGFWTNWLAVKMLFHPRRKNAVWWGLVPARREELIDGIAAGVMKQLISPEIVQEHLHKSAVIQRFVNETACALQDTLENPRFRQELKGLVYGIVHKFATSPETRRSVERLVRAKISDWTGESLGAKIAEWTKELWGPLVVKEVIQALPDLPQATDSVIAHVERSLNQVPQIMERENSRIESLITRAIVEALHNLDIKQVVKAQLSKLDEQGLERMLTGNVTTELKFIQTSGGVFGLLAGLAFIYPSSRPVLLAVGLALWAAYRTTVKKQTGLTTA